MTHLLMRLWTNSCDEHRCVFTAFDLNSLTCQDHFKLHWGRTNVRCSDRRRDYLMRIFNWRPWGMVKEERSTGSKEEGGGGQRIDWIWLMSVGTVHTGGGRCRSCFSIRMLTAAVTGLSWSLGGRSVFACSACVWDCLLHHSSQQGYDALCSLSDCLQKCFKVVWLSYASFQSVNLLWIDCDWRICVCG